MQSAPHENSPAGTVPKEGPSPTPPRVETTRTSLPGASLPETGASVPLPEVKPKTRKPSAEITFRVLVNEQINLTKLADNKAHMMIQTNALITSIMLASSGFIFQAHPWLRLPSATLAITALISILFAVLAARPKLNKPREVTAEDLHSGRANILFFGNFGRISEEEFVVGMREMFADDERVYMNMSRHVYGLGHVLLGKFRLLRISYAVFLIGLFLSGALFVAALIATGT